MMETVPESRLATYSLLLEGWRANEMGQDPTFISPMTLLSVPLITDTVSDPLFAT
jgi:hypothetical protein